MTFLSSGSNDLRTQREFGGNSTDSDSLQHHVSQWNGAPSWGFSNRHAGDAEDREEQLESVFSQSGGATAEERAMPSGIEKELLTQARP